MEAVAKKALEKTDLNLDLFGHEGRQISKFERDKTIKVVYTTLIVLRGSCPPLYKGGSVSARVSILCECSKTILYWLYLADFIHMF